MSWLVNAAVLEIEEGANVFQRFGFWEIVLILVVALVIFGPARLPQLGRSLGDSIREFRGAFRAISEEDTKPAEKQSESTER